MSEFKKVTIIGLGAMGSMLAKLLIKKNYDVTVWNRTAAKAKELVEAGAVAAADVVSAITPADIIIVCVANYESSAGILRNPEAEKALKGKIVIQLSTGTPQDAVTERKWADTIGAEYLDGAIMVTPSQMGTQEAFILVSGQADTFTKAEPVLKALAQNTLYTGENIHSASALDLAFLSYFFSALIGFSHAARIAEAEGLDITSLGSMIQNWSPAIGSIIKDCSTRVANDNYQNPQSTLQTCYLGMELISRQAREANISNLFPDFATSLFKKGMDAGFAMEEGSALFKVLK